MAFTKVTHNYVIYEKRKYRVNLSFRLVMMYFQIMQDEGLTIQEKIELASRALIVDDVSELKLTDRMKLLKQVYDEKIMTERDQRQAKLSKSGKAVFDFDQDSDLITAGFQQQYDIDLDTAQINWHKFTAMLDGLTDDTQFRKVIQYRTMKISDDMPSEQQEFIKQMKLLFSLDKHKSGEKLSRQELELELASLDMPHKVLKIKELKEKGLI